MSRTTRLPSRASRTRRRFISSWGITNRPDRLPAKIRSASRRGQVEQAGVDQVVVNDHLGAAQGLKTPARQQPGVAWTGAYEIDRPDRGCVP